MAVIDGRLVYRDGANVSNAPATSYQIADDFSGYFQGAPGDMLYVKSNNSVYISNGTSWFQVYHAGTLPPYPTSLPAAPLNIAYTAANYTMTNAVDILICDPRPNPIIITLQKCSTATKKRYDFKCFYGTASVTIRAFAGDVIDVDRSEIIMTFPSSITLVPLTDFGIYWNLI